MFKNQLVITLRNLSRQLGYTFINICGLTIGIVCCILILLYVTDEMSYDQYHKNVENIYRIGTHGVIGPNEFKGVVTPAPMAPAFIEELPEVITATRIRNYGFPVISYKDKVFSEERFFWADSTIFSIFTIPFIKGDPATALTEPNTVVFSEAMVQKYFGDEDPLNKMVALNNGVTYMVTGVMENIPHNSHFHFDFIASLVSYQATLNDFWVSNNFYTYVLLKDGATQVQLEEKLSHFVEKYALPQIEAITGQSFSAMLEAGSRYGWFVQPLSEIHLYSDEEHEIEPNGNATYVYIFTLIALGILAIACINFMNLATARSAKRAREVGVRKTLGSNRGQLIIQFLSESIFLTFIALALALVLAKLLLPYYNVLIEKQLMLGSIIQVNTLPLLLLFTVIVGILAGIYPAFILSSFKPVEVLKGSLKSQAKSGLFLRSGLVIFQFGISVALIAGTIIVGNQLNFLQLKNLGFNKEQVVVVEKTDDIGQQLDAFRNELNKIPAVVSVSNSTHYIGQNFNSNAFKVGGPTNNETQIIWTMRTDFDFASTYEVPIKEGRFYSREFRTDSSGVVLNEEAVKVLGLRDPIGKEIIRIGQTAEQSLRLTVIGVMKDFHFESLHYQIRPLIILPFGRGGFGRYVSVRIKPDNVRETIHAIEQSWKNLAGNQAFEYFFFDEEFQRLYSSEQKTGKLSSAFSFLAIFIACLGLFGLASFNAEKRTKEIGVRKVLGATVTDIVFMLFKDTAKLVVIANFIALPIIYFIMDSWLQGFAYRINIDWTVFVFTVMISFIVAILTVSYQALKAAFLNPAIALHYE
jgi:putative ABC transport system permease protein